MTPVPFHLGRGSLPAHESGLDCRIRIFQKDGFVCGVARCDTSYGPVTFSAKVDPRMIAHAAQAARFVREHLLKQATELPTESTSKYVTKAAALRDGVTRGDPQAQATVAAVKSLAATGDPKAGALLGMVASSAPSAGGASFGAATLPVYHRAAVSIPGKPIALTAAQRSRIVAVLQTAISHIPQFRLSAAARR